MGSYPSTSLWAPAACPLTPAEREHGLSALASGAYDKDRDFTKEPETLPVEIARYEAARGIVINHKNDRAKGVTRIHGVVTDVENDTDYAAKLIHNKTYQLSSDEILYFMNALQERFPRIACLTMEQVTGMAAGVFEPVLPADGIYGVMVLINLVGGMSRFLDGNELASDEWMRLDMIGGSHWVLMSMSIEKEPSPKLNITLIDPLQPAGEYAGTYKIPLLEEMKAAIFACIKLGAMEVCRGKPSPLIIGGLNFTVLSNASKTTPEVAAIVAGCLTNLQLHMSITVRQLPGDGVSCGALSLAAAVADAERLEKFATGVPREIYDLTGDSKTLTCIRRTLVYLFATGLWPSELAGPKRSKRETFYLRDERTPVKKETETKEDTIPNEPRPASPLASDTEMLPSETVSQLPEPPVAVVGQIEPAQTLPISPHAESGAPKSHSPSGDLFVLSDSPCEEFDFDENVFNGGILEGIDDDDATRIETGQVRKDTSIVAS